MMGVKHAQTSGDTELVYWKMISGGALSEALHVAARMPGGDTNRNILRIKKAGVQIVQFRSDTPLDVLRWIKAEGNNWHGGVATTFLELLAAVGEMKLAWDAHAKASDIDYNSCPKSGPLSWASQQSDWTMRHYGEQFKNSKNLVKLAKSVVASLKKFGIYDELAELCGAANRVDFLRPELSATTIIHVLHGIISGFEDAFEETIDAEWARVVLLELLKFALPWDSQAVDAPGMWVFRTMSDVTKYLPWLRTPMAGSTVYKPSAKAKPKAKAKPVAELVSDAHDAKKRKKGSGKGKTCPAKKPLVPDEVLSLSTLTTRQKEWLDDLVACVKDPIVYCDPSKVAWPVIKAQLRRGLTFCFAAKLVINGRALNGWKL
eukprot:1328455-Pyramimonas_sp.AAC.1